MSFPTNAFVIIGNPLVLSSSTYSIYANGQVGDEQIATVKPTFLASAPYGWLLCDTTVRNRADYPKLWDEIPPIFKNTANNTFVIDLREATLKGVGLTSQSSAHYNSTGLILGQFIDDRVQDHSHYRYPDRRNGWSQQFLAQAGGLFVGASNSEENNAYPTGFMNFGRIGNTTEVKAVGVNWIIKAM